MYLNLFRLDHKGINKSGNLLIQNAIDALVVQSENIEKAAKLLDINNLQVEGSDSLDNPEAVFN